MERLRKAEWIHYASSELDMYIKFVNEQIFPKFVLAKRSFDFSPSRRSSRGNCFQNRHERQGRFWMAKMAPKRIQNGAKRHPKSMQNHFKNRCKNQCRKGIGK